ncbi:MAG: integrase core domain-containing protein [Bacteroidota bacterium]|nr:integrase core domain-containing protein [Bacteroidota bacterium]
MKELFRLTVLVSFTANNLTTKGTASSRVSKGITRYNQRFQRTNIHLTFCCYAVAERIHKTIKEEFTDERQINFCNIDEAKTEIKKFIEFYNQQRSHRSVQWLTPNQAYQCTGALKRLWKPYRCKVYEWGDLAEA